MESVILAIIGGSLNRIRGNGKFTVGSVSIPAKPWQPLLMGVMAYAVGARPEYAALVSVSCWVGQAPGWGRYIGAALGEELRYPREFTLVDFFIRPLKPRGYFDELGNWYYDPRNQIYWLKAWGIAGLTLRGLFWGAMLSWFNPTTLMLGLAFPVSYLTSHFICKTWDTPNPKGDAWELAEFMVGAYLWYFMFSGLV